LVGSNVHRRLAAAAPLVRSVGVVTIRLPAAIDHAGRGGRAASRDLPVSRAADGRRVVGAAVLGQRFARGGAALLTSLPKRSRASG